MYKSDVFLYPLYYTELRIKEKLNDSTIQVPASADPIPKSKAATSSFTLRPMLAFMSATASCFLYFFMSL